MEVSIVFHGSGETYDPESWNTKVENVFLDPKLANDSLLSHGTPDAQGCVRVTSDDGRHQECWWVEKHPVK